MPIMTEMVLLELLAKGGQNALSECDSPTLNRLIYKGHVIIVPAGQEGNEVSRVRVTKTGLQRLRQMKCL